MPIITKEDERRAQERITKAHLKLDELERNKHLIATFDGCSDEACFSCAKVLLAHQQVVQCGRTECQFRMSEMGRKRLFVRTHEQHLAQINLRLG